MSNGEDDGDAGGRVPDVEVSWSGVTETYVVALERFIRGVELATATVFAALFAIGVVDLLLQIVQSAQTGEITDPLVVIRFIDTGLLLLIIVEVYQTVLAYVQESQTRSIVRLIIYTGVIAMVRKAIIFRTGEYGTTQDALFAAVAYTVIIFGLVALLLTERVYGETRLIESE
ncbi:MULTISPECIES: phosphate-starvation-inducible PsiE family protein [Halorussus]|uniref:phosphate-starvation-inducible PsiE family protein n=1 Tax=Halorussus TaxID=1070314 RepID=UPI000E214C23|nr:MULTISPECIES: phosphate-starvation-inducible PsiE family protein [Halorussus]NHN57860.1 phosphate-starvation-inducible PsiE family protein [Halorussus sp. JP-T4]